MSGHPEIDLVKDSVRRFADRIVVPVLADMNHYPDRALSSELVPGLGELGLFELDHESTATLGTALEALSEVAAAPAASVLANALARSIVASTLPEFLAGNGGPSVLGAELYAEPGLADGAATLSQKGNELLLDGTTRLVVNAPIAKHLVLTVRDATSGGEPALVVIDARAPGVGIGPPVLTLGLRGAPSARVTLESARISEERVLARSPRAAELARTLARRLFGPATAIASGIVKSSLHAAAHYAEERYQGGSAIIEHQEVRALLSGMIEAHALCQETARRLASELLPEHRSLALFIAAKERAAQACTDGVQLLGGYGYMEDFGQERCMRDAKQVQCLFGRTPYQRQELTRAFINEVSP